MFQSYHERFKCTDIDDDNDHTIDLWNRQFFAYLRYDTTAVYLYVLTQLAVVVVNTFCKLAYSKQWLLLHKRKWQSYSSHYIQPMSKLQTESAL